MARVLFVVPVGQDMGGIITSTEQYILGLEEAGHYVRPVCAVFTQRDEPIGPEPRGKFADDYTKGPGTGWLLHPTQGWRSEERFSMTNAEGRKRFIGLVKAYDYVVWASMYGFRNNATEGTTDWVECIKAAKGKNVFMIHDDHLPERYSWAGALAPYAAAFIGVQPCSYDSLRDVAAHRGMVFTPIPTPAKAYPPVDGRKGFLNCQVWKPWKNGDKLVAAAAHMPKKGLLYFAGDGIQLRYLRSKEKCPDRFVGLWDAAMKKAAYMGVLSETDRDEELRRSKFLVDLSLRHNSGQLNRIVQEAMAQGCVVIANPKFISGDANPPKSAMFQPYVHYIPIDDALYAHPKALADRLLGIERECFPEKYKTMQKAAHKLVTTEFGRAKLGQRLIDVAKEGQAAKRKIRKGELDAARAEFAKVFGELT